MRRFLGISAFLLGVILGSADSPDFKTFLITKGLAVALLFPFLVKRWEV